MRHSSDTATTAAGTSISISLVPPLCASGYGFGTGAWSVAGGAALLFLTNLVAIVAVGTMAFVAAGFKRVDVTVLEREELTKEETDSSIARALARSLAQLFESRWGPAMRFLMPFVLLAAVYVPLRSALDEVAWQVRVRAAVQQIISREPLRVVQSRVRVERREVELLVVVLGKAHDAELSRARLDAEIRQASGVTPRVDVFAVPDANAVAGLESSLLARRKVDVPVVAPAPSAEHQLNAARERVRSAVTDVWPSSSVGAPLSIDIGSASEGPLGIQIVHRGVGLSGDTLEVLRRQPAPFGSRCSQNPNTSHPQNGPPTTPSPTRKKFVIDGDGSPDPAEQRQSVWKRTKGGNHVRRNDVGTHVPGTSFGSGTSEKRS
ncbi:MAG: DUF389 domain-containing protein, partial [Myxococcales bacterium]|nr:DUF389 domain-containing protein [Myxococcales bacterium]